MKKVIWKEVSDSSKKLKLNPQNQLINGKLLDIWE